MVSRALTGNSKDTNNLQCAFYESALFDTVTHGAARRLEVAGHVTAHLNHGSLSWIAVCDVQVAGQERVCRKGTTLTVVVGKENNDDVFQCDHHEQRPDDERQDADQVLLARVFGENGRVYIERTGSDISIDDADGLECEP